MAALKVLPLKAGKEEKKKKRIRKGKKEGK